MGIGRASCPLNRTALSSCFPSTPSMSMMRTPIRLLAMPRRTPRWGSLCSRKNALSSLASDSVSRTSPPTTIPRSSGRCASLTSSACPLFTTSAAASFAAPMVRPTSFLCFAAFPWPPLRFGPLSLGERLEPRRERSRLSSGFLTEASADFSADLRPRRMSRFRNDVFSCDAAGCSGATTDAGVSAGATG